MRSRNLRVLPSKPLRGADRRLIASAAGALFLLLAISLALFLAGGHWVRRVLFFPETISRKLAAETRYLPRRGGLEGDVKLLIEEALLGPALPLHQRILPRSTHLQTVLVHRGTLIVSLSGGILIQDPECPFSPLEALQALGTLIRFNFPRARSLQLLIEGQVPFGWGEEGVRFRPELLR